MKKKRNLLVYIASLVVVMSILGGSYAYLRVEKESESQKVDLVTKFGIEITKELDGLNLSDQVPLSDEEGVKGEARTFQITNNSSILSEYKVSLIDDSVVSSLENKDVRYRLKKTKSSVGTPEVLDIKNLRDDGLLDSGTIQPGETIDYEIVCWIDYDVTIGGLIFSKKVMVEGTQPLNLDKSGANPPEMLNNMIPVYYDNGWKVADPTNRNETYKWYDYDAKMWANAVTVKSDSGADYTAMGTPINEDDITSMWVWIPRYKYTIFNNTGKNLNEKTINVRFEYGINSTGVTCADTSGTESCDAITDNLSTYTHPAFKFGDKDLVGFWFAKFEMSSPSGSDIATNPIYVKPNQESLRNITPLNMFKSVRNMEVSGNIHGFSQATTATTVADDGTIANDNNNFDIHLETNMEWGAVAYLAMSRYGINGAITPNKNYTEGSLKTGYADVTTLYSDLTTGVKASTTGTIYGVYDMVGGANEFVMGTTTPSTFNPNAKYYTKYTTLGKLGDGTKEVNKSDTNRWYDGTKKEFDTNTWLTRGGAANDVSGLSIFTNGVTNEEANPLITSRPTLTIEREIPWEKNN